MSDAFGVDYALDQLGFLQFEHLVAELFALEAAIAPSAWAGEADRLRSAESEVPIGRPLVSGSVTAPVVVQCAWVRSGHPAPVRRLVERLEALSAPRPKEWERAQSLVLVTNVDVDETCGRAEIAEAAGRVMSEFVLIGGSEISARIDAREELRRTMPSLLGLRDLSALIAAEVGQRSSLDRTLAQELARVFVPTGAYRRARGVLERHRFAVLMGPPEMGKTAIARMIGLAQMTSGWEAHECVRPEDVWAAFDAERSQVFIADDAFGSTEYRPDLAERWAREMERILRQLDDRHWLVWTSRPAPLRAALGRLHRERGAERFPAPAEVLVDASALDASDKTLILFRHAKAAALPAETREQVCEHGADIVAHRHFTPERIRRLVAVLSASNPGERLNLAELVADQLGRATEAMATSFTALGDEHRDLLIAMLDTPPGPVSDQDLSSALRRHHPGALTRSPTELTERMTDHFLRVLP